MKNASEKAEKFEKARGSLRAKTWHKIAGGLAIYEGDAKKRLQKRFSECEKLLPETKYSILEVQKKP